LTHVEPTTYKTTFQDPKWHLAMQEEYNALLHNQTWSFIPLPANILAIGCKWVFRVKENSDGTVNKYKACFDTCSYL